MEENILKIVDNSQNGNVKHIKNIKLLEKLYNSSDFGQFQQCFLRIIEGVVQEDFRNPKVECILEFLAKFIGHIVTVQSVEENDPKENSAHPLLNTVLHRVIKYHNDPAEASRHNTCIFLSHTLQNLGEDAVVDNHVIDLIQNAMLQNIQDVKPVIRLQALLALTRLQEPLNLECPVIQAYVNSLSDSNYLVRQEAVKRIAPNAFTIPKLKEKTRDVHAVVRCAAFTHIADIGIKHFKIVHRQFILQSGFTEINPQAKKTFLEYLLPRWLNCLNRSYLTFLGAIKLDSDETDIEKTEDLSSKIMQVFFKTEPINNLIEAIPLEETRVIPNNQMKSELALYWNIVVKYLRQSENLEELLDKIVPELTIFCNYIEKLITYKYSKTMEDWEYLDFHYLLYHLFDMAEHFDLSEEVGRTALDKLIKLVLSKHRLPPRLLNKIMQISSKLTLNMNSFSNEICSIISDIWQPMTVQMPDEQECIDRECKINKLTMQLNIMRGDQEDAVIAQDFQKAHDFKVQMAEYKKQLEELKAEGERVKQAKTTMDDPETICWCLELLSALLVHNNAKTLSPSLVLCRQEFLMPLIASKNMEIRSRAFKCLTMYCIFDKTLAVEQIETLCFPIISYRMRPNFDTTIMIDSVAVITDLIRMYGVELFNTEDKSATNRSTQNTTRRRLYTEDNGEGSINNFLSVDFIISVLLDMMDDENGDIRDTAATAVFKLMLNNFPINHMVMTRLIIKWYSPATQINLQQKLGVVITAYIERIPNAKQIVANSIVPILTSIADAPQASPLSEIDNDNVIRFLATLTNSGIVDGLMHVHTEVARILTQEISSRPAQGVTVYFAKMLNMLNIPQTDSPAVKELISKVELILEKEYLYKTSTRQLTKFIAKLSGRSIESTVNSTTMTGDRSANATGDQTTKNTIGQSRRLSSIIEDGSEVFVAVDNGNEADEEGLSKRRKIDDGTNQTSALPNTENAIDNDVNQARMPVDSETVVSESFGSQSDVTLSSQPSLQQECNAKKRPKNSKANLNKVTNKRRSLRNVSTKLTRDASDQSENSNNDTGASVDPKSSSSRSQSSDSSNDHQSPVSSEQSGSDSQQQIRKNTRTNAKNGPNRILNIAIINRNASDQIAQKSRSSGSNVANQSPRPSEQSGSDSQQQIKRNTRTNAKNGAIRTESGEIIKRNATNRGNRTSSGSEVSSQSSGSCSDSQQRVKRNSRTNSKNEAILHAKNGKIIKKKTINQVDEKLTNSSSDIDIQSSSSSEQAGSDFQRQIRKNTRTNAQNGAESGKIIEKKSTGRGIVLSHSSSGYSLRRDSSSSINSNLRERITRNPKTETNPKRDAKNGLTGLKNNRIVGRKVGNRAITMKTSGKEIEMSKSSGSSESIVSSSSGGSDFQKEVRRSGTTKANNSKLNVFGQVKNSKDKNCNIRGTYKKQKRKIVTGNISQDTTSSSLFVSNTESEEEGQRSTRTAAKGGEYEGEKKNPKVNGVRKEAHKENHTFPAGERDRSNSKITNEESDKGRKKLGETQEINTQLYIKISPIKRPAEAAKTVQVKRKKSIQSRSVLEESDQTLHTIVESSDSYASLLSDDSPRSTPNNSPVRLRIATSEVSSNKSPTKSIRKSTRKLKKKRFM